MDRVEIPNEATYSPVALTDLFVLAPLASRVLFGATVPGRLVQALAVGAYAGSAVNDWICRRRARPIDFRAVFGHDPFDLEPMSRESREAEVGELVSALNERYEPLTLPRRELAAVVNRRLTDYIANLTGQRVETSSEVRSVGISRLLFPFALGTCDMLSGDVTLFRDAGIFEPHVIAHEFCHRKGYHKELEAQALAYLALRSAEEPVLVQAARAERLYRNLRVLSGGDLDRYHALVDECGLASGPAGEFHDIRPHPSAYERSVWSVMKPLIEQRMRMTGQGGLADYDAGFTDFIHAQG